MIQEIEQRRVECVRLKNRNKRKISKFLKTLEADRTQVYECSARTEH